jgi:hypothetical protein
LPASADPPPAAAGTTNHGFLARSGVFGAIDHPGATTVPASPNGQAGTATTGINDRGEILCVYEGRDRVIRHFVRDRRGRFTGIAEACSLPPGRFGEFVDVNNRGGDRRLLQRRPGGNDDRLPAHQEGDGSWTSRSPARK